MKFNEQNEGTATTTDLAAHLPLAQTVADIVTEYGLEGATPKQKVAAFGKLAEVVDSARDGISASTTNACMDHWEKSRGDKSEGHTVSATYSAYGRSTGRVHIDDKANVLTTVTVPAGDLMSAAMKRGDELRSRFTN